MCFKNYVCAVSVVAISFLGGCAANTKDPMLQFMTEMDQLPPDEQLPNWENTKSLMVRNAPLVGDVAPDFELKKQYGDETIRLSEFPPTKPVVLIFGSWT